MSRSAKITLDFGDGSHDFRLRIGELIELQEKCDAGPFFILSRILTKQWRTQDVSETIRLGLIGGGLRPPEALALVTRYVFDVPDWLENAKVAEAILTAAIRGAEDEPPKDRSGKAAGEAETASPNSPEANGDGPESSPAQP